MKKIAAKTKTAAPKKPPVTKTRNKTARVGRAKVNARAAVGERAAPGGRKAQVIDLMKRPEGVTIEQITTATSMLPHSARALISGIAKTEKVSTSKEGKEPTIYRIS